MNAYDAMMRGSVGSPMILGAPEILGDPALGVTVAADTDVTKYIDKGWTASDRIYFGLGNNVLLPAAGELLFTQSVQTPFKPQRLTLPSQYCPDVVIVQAKIGSVDLIEGDPVPAEVWSEVSTNNAVSWPTLDVSQQLQIRFRNNGLVAVPINLAAWGLRLR